MNTARACVPKLPPLDEYALSLATIVARTTYLPARETVEAMRGPVFPTVRNSRLRITRIYQGPFEGMYDDNTTPRWALLWSHGIAGVGKSSSKYWTFAHIWPAREHPASYTTLANLAMIPECFASLTDKNGPVAEFLRWHAWKVYGWKPDGALMAEPPGYDEISWNYFCAIEHPREFVLSQLRRANCKRSSILKPLLLTDTT